MACVLDDNNIFYATIQLNEANKLVPLRALLEFNINFEVTTTFLAN